MNVAVQRGWRNEDPTDGQKLRIAHLLTVALTNSEAPPYQELQGMIEAPQVVAAWPALRWCLDVN
jgi:hypothetical protein